MQKIGQYREQLPRTLALPVTPQDASHLPASELFQLSPIKPLIEEIDNTALPSVNAWMTVCHRGMMVGQNDTMLAVPKDIVQRGRDH